MDSLDSPPVVLLRSPNSPTVVLRVAFRTGSAADPAGKEGLAQLAASLVAKGGSKSLSYRELLERFYPMAASLEAVCDKELTTFVGEVPSEKLEEFYPLMIEVLTSPRLDPKDFQRIRQDQLNHLENTLRGNNDEALGKWTLQTALYQGHPYGHVEEGTVRGVKGLVLEDVRSFVRERYTRENLLLGIAGGFPLGFGRRVSKDLEALPEGGTPLPALLGTRSPEGREFLIVEKDAPATAISMGFPIQVSRRDPDYYALLVANSAFGEHRTFNGRLMVRMRGLRGLNYGDYSYIENFLQDGGTTFVRPGIPRRQQYFSIWIRPVPHDKRLFAIRQAVRELDLLVEKGLAPEEFEATKKFVLNYSKLWVQTNARRLGFEMDGRIYGTRSQIDEIQERVPKLTLGEVNAAIRRHLQGKNLLIAVVTKGAEALKEQILSGAPSPLAYDTEGTAPEILEEDKLIEVYPLGVSRPISIRPVGEMFE